MPTATLTAPKTTVKPGPKAARDLTPVDMRYLPKRGSKRVSGFCNRYLRVPAGHGALSTFRLRPWQLEIAEGIFPTTGDRPSQGLVALPRANGKSALAAALCLYALYADGVESPQVLICASSEKQSQIIYNMCRRMVELSPELEKRTKILKDRLVVPGNNGVLMNLPSDKDSLHGYGPSFCVVDELHVVDEEVWEQMLLASGKVPNSCVLAVSTPSMSDTSVMAKLVANARANPDPDFYFKEYTSDASHPIDCQHCVEAANPAYGDFLTAKSLENVRKTSRESSYRVYRLGQWLEASEESYLTKPQVHACLTDDPIAKGAKVVAFTDGSYSGDTTVTVLVSVEPVPKVMLWRAWEPHNEPEGYRVPVLDVMDGIRAACREFDVVECLFDPYRYQMMMETLAAERLPVVAFPQSFSRTQPALLAFREAMLEERVSIVRNEILERHLLNARVTETDKGTRVHKKSKDSPDKIDACVSAFCAYSRATFHAVQQPKRRRVARAVG